MKYIAYGSNMVKEQMAYRCPGAKLIGTGYLPNHRLAFYLHATVERSHARNARVPVAVWEIDEADEQRLDRYEGFPNYYVKLRRRVVLSDGSEIEGMVYVMILIRRQPRRRNTTAQSATRTDSSASATKSRGCWSPPFAAAGSVAAFKSARSHPCGRPALLARRGPVWLLSGLGGGAGRMGFGRNVRWRGPRDKAKSAGRLPDAFPWGRLTNRRRLPPFGCRPGRFGIG